MNNIKIDTDPNLGYETNSTFKKAVNFFLIPILNILPKSIRGTVKKSDVSAKEIIETATSHHAIEILYQYGQPHKSRNPIQRFFHEIWFNTNNPKAVRNRLRLVIREVINAIDESIKKDEEIVILSIASGSARAIVESIKNERFLNRNISVSFLDKNPKALEYSKWLVSEYNFPQNYSFQWIEDQAKKFQNYFDGKSPNIIETVGLMDYFNDEDVLSFFTHVYNQLRDGGTFITANITDNPERKFVTNVVGWNMIYRQPKEFYDIAIKAGFKNENIQMLIEPMGIHLVMIMKK